MKVFKILLNREILLTWRIGYFLNLVALFLVLSILFSLSQTNNIEHVFILFLIIQFLSITVSTPALVEYDHKNHMLTSLIIAGHGTLRIVISKTMVYWLVNSIVSLLFFISYMILSGATLKSIVFYGNILITTSLIITAISLLVTTLTINLSKNIPLILLIASPLYMAFLLYGYSLSTSYTMSPDTLKYWLNIKILWSFCLIIIPTSIFACSYILSRIE